MQQSRIFPQYSGHCCHTPIYSGVCSDFQGAFADMILSMHMPPCSPKFMLMEVLYVRFGERQLLYSLSLYHPSVPFASLCFVMSVGGQECLLPVQINAVLCSFSEVGYCLIITPSMRGQAEIHKCARVCAVKQEVNYIIQRMRTAMLVLELLQCKNYQAMAGPTLCALSHRGIAVFTCESSYAFSASQPSQFCPSVCLSVCLSHGWIRQKRSKLGSPNFHRRLPGRLQFQEP